MSRNSKGSLVLAMLLFLGSAPTWAAAPAESRTFADSDGFSALSAAVSGWLGSVLQAGQVTVKAIWGEYGIAIDPDGQPADPSRAHDAGATSAH